MFSGEVGVEKEHSVKMNVVRWYRHAFQNGQSDCADKIIVGDRRGKWLTGDMREKKQAEDECRLVGLGMEWVRWETEEKLIAANKR